MTEKKLTKENASFRLFGNKVSPDNFLSVVSTEGVEVHFGQSAEDIILLRLFKKIKGDFRDGFYIDVGAFHPRKYSNTFVLHNFFGWKGINIDASKESIALFDQERPNDINVHTAVGEFTGKAIYWKFKSPEINTISEDSVQRQLLRGKKATSKENVQVRPLADILEEYLPNGRDIDLLNIDVEGLDFQVLKSNNWTKYRPRVILIEDYSIQTSELESSAIFSYLKDIGYRFFSHAFDTSIYLEEEYLTEQRIRKVEVSSKKNKINYLNNSFLKKIPNVYDRTVLLAKAHPVWKELNQKTGDTLYKVNQTLDDIIYKREKNKILLEKLSEKETLLNEVRSKNQKIIKDLKRYEKKSEDIIESRTWRYTLPIRKVMEKIKQYRSKYTNSIGSEIKRVNDDDEHKKAKRHIQRLKLKLFNLGFSERALAELWKIVMEDSSPILKRLAAQELSLWYANQRDKDGARQCLKLLPTAMQGEEDPTRVRQLTVLEVECHDILGDIGEAKRVITNALTKNQHADLFFAAANLESVMRERLKWINKALEAYGIAKVSLIPSMNHTAYDSLTAEKGTLKYTKNSVNLPKVTVIIPVYNAEFTIRTALNSILSQTWVNLEVLVVDDCSTDNTVEVIRDYEKKDSRVTLMSTDVNSGPYVARNLALSVAKGDFVTVNDADDWSHPEKIERQVTHLINNPSIIGNTSQQARATEELKFYRRGNFRIMFANMSSFMFRRELVMEEIGYLDSVRFAADAEFIRRVKKVFGKNAVVDLPTGPLSFQRQTDDSLTGNSAFGFHGYFMGARKEYVESQAHFHEHGDSLRYKFPQNIRPFPVPEPMWPIREVKVSERRHFDVIIASDFRLESSTLTREEIKVRKQMGLRTGLIQINCYDVAPNKKIHKHIRELLDGDQVQMLVYGEKLSSDLLIIMSPQILQEYQRFIPDVKADKVCVIVDQPPLNDYRSNSYARYDIRKSKKNLEDYFGKPGTWYPINSVVRKKLIKHHSDELSEIRIADKDWSRQIK